jgi:hypothetical protein
VIAALNLVFQPRTPTRTPDGSALGHEIDLILGPVTLSSDPTLLLAEPP